LSSGAHLNAGAGRDFSVALQREIAFKKIKKSTVIAQKPG
jgi:hypothetical protein